MTPRDVCCRERSGDDSDDRPGRSLC